MNEIPDHEVAIFNGALQLPAQERAAYLAIACAGDEDLMNRVNALLEAHDKAEGFLQQATPEPTTISPNPPTGSKGGTVRITPILSEKPGELIGRYKLLQQIGEGGCGVVYMAEQEQPVRRRVALKIIKLGMDTNQVVARFDAERQALAMMDHPNIAKVLDAGATDNGRPFFVMELVRGVKITDYCDQNKLSTDERLELFIQVCHAIQHAHQKGIIHRDVKPSNILVTLHDGVPVPKVIDFGIAKATQGRLTDRTVFTAFEQFIGTPAYMSPEQAEMSGLDIDTRTDIYSLGVLLYELLTGKTPFDSKELVAAGLEQMRRTIRDKEPLRPSTCLSTMLKGELTTTAQHRSTEALRLIHVMRGDLDWIVLKCLEKDRTRRYDTANGLAMDIRRHLDDDAVLARPPSKLYRAQKTIQRNKLAFAAGAMAVAALVAGAIITTSLAFGARREGDAATHARQQSEAIGRFLTEDLLYQATPDQNAREKKVTVEQVLARAARKLDQDAEIARHPELEATLRYDIGSTYFKLGVLNEAERHLRRSASLRRSAFGLRNLETLAAQQALAELLITGVRRFEEAESVVLEIWQARQALLGAENRNTLDSMSLYIAVLANEGKHTEAEAMARQHLEISERVLGPDDHDTVVALVNLALLVGSHGNYEQAEHYEREAQKRYERSGLGNNVDAFWSLNNLAAWRFFQGDAAGAKGILASARPRAIKVFGPEHPVTLQMGHLLARVMAEEGQLDQAMSLAQEVLDVRRRLMPLSEYTGRTLLVLGRIQIQAQQFSEAEQLLRQAQALFEEHYAAKRHLIAQVENALGGIYLARHDLSKAETMLLPNAQTLQTAPGELTDKEIQTAVGYIIEFYRSVGKPEQASVWEATLNQVKSGRATSL